MNHITRITLDYLLWDAKKFIDYGQYDLARESIEKAIETFYDDWKREDLASIEQVNELKLDEVLHRGQ